MKKRFACYILSLALVMAAVMPAFATGDTVFSRDTTLTKFINRYNRVTIKSGVTITMNEMKPDPQGLEIGESLTVERGGSITGPGIIIFNRGAVSSGLDLYYAVGGQEILLPVDLNGVLKLFPNLDDYRPTFRFNSETGHFVLDGGFVSDPFAQPSAGGSLQNRTLQIAEALKTLGLFRGTGTNADGSTNFALDRAPTRIEAVIMLIRLLGREEEALAFPASACVFEDVPEWARSYVAYAYESGMTKGVSATKFGTGEATVYQFLTFVLRAMGYSEAAGDFYWDRSDLLADKLGLIAGDDDLQNFTRGTAVRIMEAALRNAMRDGTKLYQKLADSGVFTEEAYLAAVSGL